MPRNVPLWEGVILMSVCKHNYDEICTNADCPLVADYCPVPDTANVCQWEDRKGSDDNENPN